MTEKKQRNIFKTWLVEHKALLFKVVRAYAFNWADRDDLFQEIAIQLWRSVPNFREESALTTCAISRCAEHRYQVEPGGAEASKRPAII